MVLDECSCIFESSNVFVIVEAFDDPAAVVLGYLLEVMLGVAVEYTYMGLSFGLQGLFGVKVLVESISLIFSFLGQYQLEYFIFFGFIRRLGFQEISFLCNLVAE